MNRKHDRNSRHKCSALQSWPIRDLLELRNDGTDVLTFLDHSFVADNDIPEDIGGANSMRNNSNSSTKLNTASLPNVNIGNSSADQMNRRYITFQPKRSISPRSHQSTTCQQTSSSSSISQATFGGAILSSSPVRLENDPMSMTSSTAISRHTTAEISSTNQSQNNNNIKYCRRFFNGNCKFGSLCHNSHVIPTTSLQLNNDGFGNSFQCRDGHNSVNKHSVPKTVINNWALAPIFVPNSQKSSSGSATNTPSERIDSRKNRQSTATTVCVPNNENCDIDNEFHRGNSASSVLSNCGASAASVSVYATNATIKRNNRNTLDYLHPPGPSLRCFEKRISYTEKGKSGTETVKSTPNYECKQSKLEHTNSFRSRRIEISKDKSCGICFEIVVDKSEVSEARFGILTNCNHIFCLTCIHTWRKSKQFHNHLVRACPECRIRSDFVCPSKFWYESPNEKQKIISDYKNAMKRQDCKHFDKGNGRCPFGNKCFYKHTLPDGVPVDVGLPPPKRTRCLNSIDLDLDFIREIFMGIFSQDSDEMFSDSDDTDNWSDFELDLYFDE